MSSNKAASPIILYGVNGLKFLLQALIVSFHAASWSSDTSFNHYINSGPWAVSLYFIISGFLVGCNPPTPMKSLLPWIQWWIRRIIPIAVMVYLIWPLTFMFAPTPRLIERPITWEPLFWTWCYYWNRNPLPAVYETNHPLWFISVLILFQILTPVLLIIIETVMNLIGDYLTLVILFICDILLWKSMPPFIDAGLFSLVKYTPWTYITIYTFALGVGILKRRRHNNTNNIHWIIIDIIAILSIIWTYYTLDPPGGYILNNGNSPLGDASHASILPWSIFLYLTTNKTASKSMVIRLLESRYLKRLGGHNGGVPFIFYMIHYPMFYWLTELKLFAGLVLIHCFIPIYIISTYINEEIYHKIKSKVDMYSRQINRYNRDDRYNHLLILDITKKSSTNNNNNFISPFSRSILRLKSLLSIS